MCESARVKSASVLAQGGGLQSDLVFAEIGRRIKEAGPELVKKVNAVFGWEITDQGQTAARWSAYGVRGKGGGGEKARSCAGRLGFFFLTICSASNAAIDLKNGGGSLQKGPCGGKADVTFTVADQDFVEVVQGKLDPQQVGRGGARGQIPAPGMWDLLWSGGHIGHGRTLFRGRRRSNLVLRRSSPAS